MGPSATLGMICIVGIRCKTGGRDRREGEGAKGQFGDGDVLTAKLINRKKNTVAWVEVWHTTGVDWRFKDGGRTDGVSVMLAQMGNWWGGNDRGKTLRLSSSTTSTARMRHIQSWRETNARRMYALD